jgi:hypothetical protein
MRTIIFFIALVNFVQAQTNNYTSEIDNVTIYLDGARIHRISQIQVPTRATTVTLQNLSPDIDPNSIQVSGLDGIKLLGLNYEVKRSESKAKTSRYSSIESSIDSARQAVQVIDAKLLGLKEELLVLQSNRGLNNSDSGISLTQVKSFSTYYNKRTEAIAINQSDLKSERAALNKTIANLKADLSSINPDANAQQGTISLKLNAVRRTSATVELDYTVKNAGWIPSYDITAGGPTEEISVEFKAQIYQETGTDWDDVKITVSTGDPMQDNTKPVLDKKTLRFVSRYTQRKQPIKIRRRYNPTVKAVRGKVTDMSGDPILGATVIVPGTNNATTTDLNGNYEIDIIEGQQLRYSFSGYDQITMPIYSSVMNQSLSPFASLDAVVVTGYRTTVDSQKNVAASTTAEREIETVENIEERIASKEYRLSQTYSIPSTGEITEVDISKKRIKASFEYYTAPVVNNNVFLTATIKDLEQLNLVAGEANIYFEDAYNGKIYFDPNTAKEELVISLGIDPQIVVERKNLKSFERKSFLGGNIIEEKEYEITLKNNRQDNVTIKLQDRIPVSSNDSIEVEKIETGNAVVNKETMILSWMIELSSGEQEERRLSYQIKYPKNRLINAER